MPETFSSIIYPMQPEDFLKNYYSKKAFFIEGTPDKFKKMFDWQALNNVFETSQMKTNDVILSNPKGHNHIDLVHKSVIIENCNEGATMQLAHLNDYSLELKKLSVKLSDELQVLARVWAFISYPGKRMFHAHCDFYETFVLLLEGEKSWEIYEPGPVKVKENTDFIINLEEFKPQRWLKETHNFIEIDRFSEYKYKEDDSPTGKPICLEKTLKPGDLLYFPTLFWHRVIPGTKPSLHLEFCFTHTRGMDFMVWLKEKLQNDGFLQDFLPLTMKEYLKKGTQGNRDNFVENIKNKIFENINFESLLSDYKQSLLMDHEQAELFNFPYPYIKDTISDPEEKLFSKNFNHYHIGTDSLNKLSVTVNGKHLVLDKTLEPFINYIFKVNSFTLRDLFENLQYSSFSPVLGVLNYLVRNNIIIIVEE